MLNRKSCDIISCPNYTFRDATPINQIWKEEKTGGGKKPKKHILDTLNGKLATSKGIKQTAPGNSR